MSDGSARMTYLEQIESAPKLVKILSKATEVFGDRQTAENWMVTPAIGLDQRRPVDLLATPAGTKLVEYLLIRMDYGVYT